MNIDEEFASDSEESDEDFNPEKAAARVAGLSEEESADDETEDLNEAGESQTATKKRRTKKLKKKVKQVKSQIEDDVENDDEEQQSSVRRSTRNSKNGLGKSTLEKKELESEEDEKSRTDALWADFLNDAKQPEGKKPSLHAKSANDSGSKKIATPTTNGKKSATVTTEVEMLAEKTEGTPKTVTITEVLDFAGEEVHVQKTVSADSIKENKVKTLNASASTRGPPTAFKRAAPGGRLGSVLNQIGKKKKISVLEKSKLDWNSFKQDEGIDEQLQTFNKGKDGYLERQDFLQRTDLRQFEIEKNIRLSRQQNN